MNTTFERTENTTVEWLTPPELVKKLGVFDLDPCCPVDAPFYHATKNYSILEDGLNTEWIGRVYMNPPYGKGMEKWIQKLKKHGNGITLIFARTETKCFFEHIWNDAHAILFMKGRVKFYRVNGIQGGAAGAPSVLVAYGEQNAQILKNANIEGRFIKLK